MTNSVHHLHSRTAMASNATPPKERILSEKWDYVVSNGVVKSGLGFGVGVIASVILFKRRAWPVWLGLGFGAGRAWADGDAVFRIQALPPAESGKREFKA